MGEGASGTWGFEDLGGVDSNWCRVRVSSSRSGGPEHRYTSALGMSRYVQICPDVTSTANAAGSNRHKATIVIHGRVPTFSGCSIPNSGLKIS